MDPTRLIERGYNIEFHSHAAAILQHDFPNAWREIEDCLLDFSIPIEEVIGSGGGEAKGTQRLRRSLTERGWKKLNFVVEKTINGVPREATSHQVDHVKTFPRSSGSETIALEIEWNNKDPFFDRDLENFKRLHSEGAISVGIILTRGEALQNSMQDYVRRFVQEEEIQGFSDLEKFGYSPTKRQREGVEQKLARAQNPLSFEDAFVQKFVSDKFGTATTHWSKLQDRIARGVGYPCPIALIGLPAEIVVFGS